MQSWLNSSPSFKAMIIGKLLGDGCITLQKGRKPRFQFTHRKKDYQWIYYCYSKLGKEIPLNPPKYKKVIDHRLKHGSSECYYVQSKTSDIITYLRAQWYPNSVKIIPFNHLMNYFNEQALAWWYMDDGHLKLNENIPEKIILSTDSFTIEENHMLIEFLQQKYSLQFHLDKQNRIILYNQFQIYYFLCLVTPYLHESMNRKFISSYNIQFNSPSRRTTIYLPSFYDLKYPTKEINNVLNKLNNIIGLYKNDLFYDTYFTVPFDQKETKGYQIVIYKENINNLEFMHRVTGLNYSKLTELCFSL
ncbi:endonuclease [Ornithinibacillus sp. L9]|uniref:Endonuclease n=1 Tax=Ornithinibacillus caprae TaxID=2678566 RepID=A0A6N8FHX0_9BACI|nr:endonuclease [Ornithinibacillus caprae]MUK89033.1 endonuclease [Ornithinibacillus caprae]